MTQATQTLTDFLLARIAEDEADANRAAKMRYDLPTDAPWERARLEVAQGLASSYAAHQGRWSPARVLAECEAKRRIVELHPSDGDHCCSDPEEPHYGEKMYYGGSPCPTLRLLALPYADHPGYRDEWRP